MTCFGITVGISDDAYEDSRTRTTMKPYKARSLKAAERAVRSLTKQRDELDELLAIFDRERKMLAKLAADTPQFFNPLDVMEAKKIRDLILKQLND